MLRHLDLYVLGDVASSKWQVATMNINRITQKKKGKRLIDSQLNPMCVCLSSIFSFILLIWGNNNNLEEIELFSYGGYENGTGWVI